MTDAAQYVVLIVYASLLLVIIVFAIATNLLLGQQKARNYQMQLREAEQRLETETMKIRLELREEAYNAFSREIHDNLGQILSSVSLALQSINNTTPENMQQQIIIQSSNRVNQVTGDLRTLSHLLSGKRVENDGLITSLEKEVAFLRNNNILQINYQRNPKDPLPPFSGSQTLLVFRIAQEAIHNVIKHAKAKQASVSVRYDPVQQHFSMQIIDKGIGFSSPASTGIGLISMKDRAKLLNGTLSITSIPTKGTSITLTLKCPNEKG